MGVSVRRPASEVMSRRIVVMISILCGVSAVAGGTHTCLAQPEPPHLVSLAPASGPAGPAYPLRVTIDGTGFMPTGNVVEFGPVRIPSVESPDGARIIFGVPKLIPRRGEVPPAVLTPGEYPVTVTTSLGRSNSLNFTLTRGPP
jgi:hypothetical protein